ncbi:ADP-ribosylglycohydrolase family protein [Photobacterium sagamiensis]|uniref:ADP-ribosylglycohydrolase family protein n=1 Tax=Photobacterium sagamiensis TaxID=2910241 RepID=UPI003D1525A6
MRNTSSNSFLVSRAKGAFLGLALGDALGTSLEFKPPGSFEPITDMLGGGPFGLDAGQWTDDTSMALCLADSLLARGKNDIDDQMVRYIRWANNGENASTGTCFDIGNTIRQALDRYLATGKAKAGRDDEYSAGNGSLMRIAPIALFYHSKSIPVLLKAAADASMTTHAEPRCIQACQLYCYYLQRLLRSPATPTKEALLFELSKPMQVRTENWHAQIKAITEGCFIRKPVSQIRGRGFVVESLEAALWCFWHSDSFEQGALMAANFGDDADTTAAIYGQLAGAYYGYQSLPQRWLDRLYWRANIEDLALMLVRYPSRQKLAKFVQFNQEWTETFSNYPRHSEQLVEHAISMFFTSLSVYDICIPDWDWMDWLDRNQLKQLSASQLRQWIDRAGTGQLIAYLTMLVRSERFCHGTIAESIEQGTLQAVIAGLDEGPTNHEPVNG